VVHREWWVRQQGIEIKMEVIGSRRDNIFVERMWKN
jgi:hypothetical protein